MDAKRMSVTVTKEQELAILELRKSDAYCKCSFAEIIRSLLDEGIKEVRARKDSA